MEEMEPGSVTRAAASCVIRIMRHACTHVSDITYDDMKYTIQDTIHIHYVLSYCNGTAMEFM